MVDEPTASDTASGLRPGSRFGHYRLKRLLGRGGFGEVYEAEDTVMDRAVALKLLATGYSQNEAFRQRLYREARNAGKLHEPHVVPVHHCGEIDGQLYIDMRLIDGTDLQKVLARNGPLSPARAVAIVRQIAAALNAAHNIQMIHRDIKPANILLTDDDFAYLVDFGLANAATDAKLTSSGTTIGTFAYMAPERFSNTAVSHRADIYALACVLYECLTGSPPYPTGDLPALINAHLTAPIPRPSQRRPQIPAGFDDVIAVGLAKNPKDRYERASDLAAVARHALRPAGQRQADAIGARTAAANTKGRGEAAVTAMPRAKTVQPPAKAAGSPGKAVRPAAKTVQPAAKPALRRRLGRRKAITFAVITFAALAALALIPIAIIVTLHQASPEQIQQLGFSGLLSPRRVAVDTAGNVYLTDDYERVLKLPAGSRTEVELPSKLVSGPSGLAVDTTGVYVADASGNRVLKLPAGSDTQVELPFTGLKTPRGVAVDGAGNVYLTDTGNNRVLKLPAGSNTQVELAFGGLDDPEGVAVDGAGNVYLTDTGNTRVLKLPAGSNTQVELPFRGLKGPTDLALDALGNVYLSDSGNNRVLKLPGGSDTQVELPFSGLNTPRGVAVDAGGNLYVVDTGNNRVLKSAAQ